MRGPGPTLVRWAHGATDEAGRLHGGHLAGLAPPVGARGRRGDREEVPLPRLRHRARVRGAPRLPRGEARPSPRRGARVGAREGPLVDARRGRRLAARPRRGRGDRQAGRMSDEELALAREALRLRPEPLVGEGPIPRFEEALTHPSFANEVGGPDNQRLEFLGDAVLGLCVSEMLVQTHVDADEGKLTRMRSALVNGEALAAWARHVDLGGCVAFGRGAKLGTEREQTNVLADAAEALVAAVY